MLGTSKTVELSTKARDGVHNKTSKGHRTIGMIGTQTIRHRPWKTCRSGSNPKDETFPAFPKPGLKATTTHRIIGSAQWAKKDRRDEDKRLGIGLDGKSE